MTVELYIRKTMILIVVVDKMNSDRMDDISILCACLF